MIFYHFLYNLVLEMKTIRVWFGVELWFFVDTLTDSDCFTVVVNGTRNQLPLHLFASSEFYMEC